MRRRENRSGRAPGRAPGRALGAVLALLLVSAGPRPGLAQEITGRPQVIDAGTLEVTVTGKSGPRKTRVWDLVVTLSSGVSAVCAGCLTISP